MMRRMKLLVLWLFAAMLACCAFACAAEMTPYDVTNMEEAERFVPFDAVWAQPRPSYAQEYGFTQVTITPDDAYARLKKAYSEKQAAGYAAVMQGWGFAALDEDSAPYGWPERRTLGEDIYMDGESVSLEAIRFSGGYADVSEQTLLFMKREYGEWQLIDMVRGEAESVRMTSEDSSAEALIECLLIGHGTGYYAEMISVYNPRTRRSEAAYTREGHECPLMDRNLYVSSWADYDYDGLRIVASSVFGTYEQAGTMRTFTQRAQAADVYVYALEGDGMHLRVHERYEDLSPAVLRGQSVSAYLSGDILFLQ